MDNNKTITLVNFYMVQIDNGSMETMDTRQHRFTEANKEWRT
jgi:hypothetical protein